MPTPPDRNRFSHVVGVVSPSNRGVCHQVSYNPSEDECVYRRRAAWCGKAAPRSGWKIATDDNLENCEDCV